jgi:hypothetical protein
VPICISRLDATVMSKRSTLQPPNPDRASDRPMGTNPYRVSKWPIGTNLNRGREPPVRIGPIVRLSGIQVAKRETRHGSRHDKRGGALHMPHYSRPLLGFPQWKVPISCQQESRFHDSQFPKMGDLTTRRLH